MVRQPAILATTFSPAHPWSGRRACRPCRHRCCRARRACPAPSAGRRKGKTPRDTPKGQPQRSPFAVSCNVPPARFPTDGVLVVVVVAWLGLVVVRLGLLLALLLALLTVVVVLLALLDVLLTNPPTATSPTQARRVCNKDMRLWYVASHTMYVARYVADGV